MEDSISSDQRYELAGEKLVAFKVFTMKISDDEAEIEEEDEILLKGMST